MADYYVLDEDYYELHLSGFVERPWTLMEPLYIGDVPSGRGTPDCYCSVERNGEPHFLVNIYGSSSFGVQATFWHSWLVIGSAYSIHFLSMEKTGEIASFNVGYFCGIFPTEEYLFVGSSSDVFCFERDAQQRWKAQNVGIDGAEITSVEDERVQGRGFCYTGSDEYDWIPFVLSLATGQVIN